MLVPSTVMTVAEEKSANKNTAACEAITDWLLSEEGQSYIVKGWMHSVLKDFPTEPYDGADTKTLMETNIPRGLGAVLQESRRDPHHVPGEGNHRVNRTQDTALW